MNIATAEETRIAEEVRSEGGAPYERLKAKCQWEHMSQLAVIRTWGDPRKWNPTPASNAEGDTEESGCAK